MNWTWSDDVPLTTTGLSYRRHRANLDAGWRLTNHVSLSVSARNLLNSAYLNLQWVAPSTPGWTRNATTGVSWTFAIKGVY